VSDNILKVWDASTGACLQTLDCNSWITSVAFSHNSTKLALALENTVEIWDVSSGACLQTLEGHTHLVKSIVFSHDSTKLASASSDKTVKVWDASSWLCLQTLGHRDRVSSATFSHDSTKLASASDDNTVKVWYISSSSWACLQTLKGHTKSIWSIAFSHDSTKLASASSDYTVKIWDACSGACLHTLNVGKNLFSISFDPTDSFLYSEIGAIAIYSPGTSIRTEPERPQYLGIRLSSDTIWIQYTARMCCGYHRRCRHWEWQSVDLQN
jgi:WD40 repeat protein